MWANKVPAIHSIATEIITNSIFFLGSRGMMKRVLIKRKKNIPELIIRTSNCVKGKLVCHRVQRTPSNQRLPEISLLPRYRKDLMSTGDAETANAERHFRIMVILNSFQLKSQYMK